MIGAERNQAGTCNPCPPETHTAAKGSLAAFAVACGGSVYLWPSRAAARLIAVGGTCAAWKSDLAIRVTSAQWAAFAGAGKAAA